MELLCLFAVGAKWDCLYSHLSCLHFISLIPLGTVQYILTYCLKGLLNKKKSTKRLFIFERRFFKYPEINKGTFKMNVKESLTTL